MKLLILLILSFTTSCYLWPSTKQFGNWNGDRGCTDKYRKTPYPIVVDNMMKMSIYYETRCSDSGRFITKQLYPAYETLKKYFKIEFVPYGKATSKKTLGSWVFKCQHGPLECWGNRVQACVLAQNAGQDAEMEFVNCFMSQHASKKDVYDCSIKAGMSYLNIMQCADSEIGNELLAQYGDVTNEKLPPVKYVPTIIFNENYNADVDEKARLNLLDATSEILNSMSREKNTIQERILPEDEDSIEIPTYVDLPRSSLFYDIFGSLKKIMYGNRITKMYKNL